MADGTGRPGSAGRDGAERAAAPAPVVAVLSNECEVLALPDEPPSNAHPLTTERWLQTIEERVHIALEEQIAAAFSELASARAMTAAWCAQWTCQAIVTASQLRWTAAAASALERGGADALSDLRAALDAQAQVVLAALGGDASACQRTALVALLTLVAHQRDVVTELHASGAAEVETFEWLCQLRFKWEPAAAATSRGSSRSHARRDVKRIVVQVSTVSTTAACVP
jgi:hypothetical protein